MHEPVMPSEVIEYLRVAHLKSGDWFLDATLGAAGHTIQILKSGGKVLGLDADPAMLDIAKQKIDEASSACPVPISDRDYTLKLTNFIDIKSAAKQAKIEQFAGILFDLGISNIHYQQTQRGFSFSDPNAVLDMRLDAQKQDIAAKDLLNILREDQLVKMFEAAMPVSESRALASKIVKARTSRYFELMGDFLNLFGRKVGKIHPATTALMALRIAVNSEFENIKLALPDALDILRPNGRLVVITFHSQEDRIVKEIFLDLENSGKARIVTKKPINPTPLEIKNNPKARSANLRCIERI